MKQVNDFSHTVTAEASKKRCAIKLLTATVHVILLTVTLLHSVNPFFLYLIYQGHYNYWAFLLKLYRHFAAVTFHKGKNQRKT